MGAALSTLAATLAVTGVSITSNLVISAVLERLFPVFNPAKNVWVGFVEAVAEFSAFILFSGLITRSFNSGLVSFLPQGIPVSSLLFIYFLYGAREKCEALIESFANGAASKYGRPTGDRELSAESADERVGGDEYSE